MGMVRLKYKALKHKNPCPIQKAKEKLLLLKRCKRYG